MRTGQQTLMSLVADEREVADREHRHGSRCRTPKPGPTAAHACADERAAAEGFEVGAGRP